MVPGGVPPPEKPGWGGGTPIPPLAKRGVQKGTASASPTRTVGNSLTVTPRLQYSSIKLGGGYPCHPSVVLGGHPPSKKPGWGGEVPPTPHPPCCERGGSNREQSRFLRRRLRENLLPDIPRRHSFRHKTGRGGTPPPMVLGGSPPSGKNRVGGEVPPTPPPGISLPGSGATGTNEFRILLYAR